jgi:hypothetical protein
MIKDKIIERNLLDKQLYKRITLIGINARSDLVKKDLGFLVNHIKANNLKKIM